METQQRRSGFTLTELLVVIVVLVVVSSFLLVALSAARDKARAATCINNLHQHGLGLAQFVGDNHCYPLALSARNATKADEAYLWWIEAILPKADLNTESKSVLDCPAASRPTNFPQPYAFNDYGYNAWGLNGPGVRPLLGIGGHGSGMAVSNNIMISAYGPTVKESEAKNPGGLVATGDGIIGWNSTFEDGTTIFWARSSSATAVAESTQRVPKRHRQRANIAFADGHVSAIPLSFLFQDQSAGALAIWNVDGEPHPERLKN
jgi:prepilin-type processing-associated H-X9-DG protein/prepilin-type N-terminal cleavage/methylation domain-containing protein